jgi:hypothetical protein
LIHLVGSLQANLHPQRPTLAGLAVSRKVDIKPSSGDDFFRNKLLTSCCAAFFCARGSHLCDLPTVKVGANKGRSGKMLSGHDGPRVLGGKELMRLIELTNQKWIPLISRRTSYWPSF